MKKALMVSLLLGIAGLCQASTLEWDTPVGTFGLPFTATEALIGYDAINKQAIAGASLPVYTDPAGIIVLQVGAVAPWQTNEVGVQPYIAAGHDIMKEITNLPALQSLHLNIFARWDTGNGKPGVGLAVSYSFAGGSFAQ